jgi:exosortase
MIRQKLPMASQKPLQIASVPASFFFGLALAGCFMAFVAWDQSFWWRENENYSYGWLVPVFIGYVIFDRWPKVVALASGGKAEERESGKALNWEIEKSGNEADKSGNWETEKLGDVSEFRCIVAAEASEWNSRTGWLARLASPIAAFLLVGGSVLFLGSAVYRRVAGVTHMTTVAITLGMAATVIATVYCLAPTNASSPAGRAVDRLGIARLFLFPTFVWLLSAPMLSEVENNLNLFLMGRVTSVVFFVFNQLGLVLEQRGNVLVLPTGSVGVAEACSGIRSLTGCLFAGSFLAAVFLRSRWKQALLVGTSLLFAVLANLLRSIFLTSWAYAYGANAIEGTVHDVTGYAVLGLTVVALLCLLPFLDRGSRRQQPAVSAKL